MFCFLLAVTVRLLYTKIITHAYICVQLYVFLLYSVQFKQLLYDENLKRKHAVLSDRFIKIFHSVHNEVSVIEIVVVDKLTAKNLASKITPKRLHCGKG